MSCLQ